MKKHTDFTSPDFSLTFSIFPDFSLTTLEFPDFSRFSRCVVTLDAPVHGALQVSVELLAGTTSVPDWRRKPARPRSSWLRGVLKDVQLTAQEAWTATDDREGWRVPQSFANYAF